jgi:hypothetical protein
VSDPVVLPVRERVLQALRTLLQGLPVDGLQVYRNRQEPVEQLARRRAA